MQLIRSFEHENAALVGFGIRVMLLSAEGEGSVLARRLQGLGGMVEHSTEMFGALESIIDDPAGYGLFVLDCDSFGGLEAGYKAVAMMADVVRRVPVVLISQECEAQSFPPDRGLPTVLRAPVSAVALRVGFEHALRDRLAVRLI